jgi:crotonobetainyl-CoA:carnitine CoA-transferase CaiB-like acyl-CoA transferase
MHDSMLAGTPNVLGPTLAENRQPVPTHERSTGGSAFYRLYETADGRHLALGGQEPKFVRNLLGALGRPDLAPLCDKPGRHQKPVMEFLGKTFRGRTLAENLAFLSTLDVCYAPVNTLPEAFEAAADKLLKDELGRRHLAPPIRYRDEPARPSLREPRLGEHDALKKR